MPDQRDVQQLIQSLTPSAVNNGNPNTVYNQPQPQGGYIPPTFDPGTNTWRINPAPAPSAVNWQQMSASQPQTWSWQQPAQPAPIPQPNGPMPTTPTTPIPTTPTPVPPGSTVGGYNNGASMNSDDSGFRVAGNAATEGCVVVNTYLQDFDRADQVEVGDDMFVVDPISYKKSVGRVSYSTTKLMPCVRITTENGIVLECSTTAPIADERGEQVLAPNLLHKLIPVCDNGMFYLDRVETIEDIGEQEVRHITVEDNFFLAGKEKGRYIFHHNMKMGPGSYIPYDSGGMDFMFAQDFGGRGAESMGNHSMFGSTGMRNDNMSTGQYSQNGNGWFENSPEGQPLGQGIIDAFGATDNPLDMYNKLAESWGNSAAPISGNAWGNITGGNVSSWNPNMNGNIPTMPTVQAVANGGGMYNYQNTAPEANDTDSIWKKGMNWLDNNLAGNMYDETTNTWNKGNIGWGVLGALTGMPLDDIAQRTSLNNLFGNGGMGSDYARTQAQQAYDRSNVAQREAMITNLAEKYEKTPMEVLQIIGRAQ